MDMTITVDGIRGCDHEVVKLRSGCVTRLRAPNGWGKTSIAAAVVACVARDPNPLRLRRMERYRAEDRVESDPAKAMLELKSEGETTQWALWDVEGQRVETSEGWSAQRTPRPWLLAGTPSYEGTGQGHARAWTDALMGQAPSQSEVSDAIGAAIEECKPGKGAPEPEHKAHEEASTEVGNAIAEAEGETQDRDVWDDERTWDRAHRAIDSAERRARNAFAQTSEEGGRRATYRATTARAWRPAGWEETWEQREGGAAVRDAVGEAHTALESAEATVREAHEARALLNTRTIEGREHRERTESARARRHVAAQNLQTARETEREATTTAREAETKVADAQEEVGRLNALAHQAQERAAQAQRALGEDRDRANGHRRQVERIESESTAAAAELDSAKAALTDAQREVERLSGAKGQCPTCAQQWSEAEAKLNTQRAEGQRRREEREERVREATLRVERAGKTKTPQAPKAVGPNAQQVEALDAQAREGHARARKALEAAQALRTVAGGAEGPIRARIQAQERLARCEGELATFEATAVEVPDETAMAQAEQAVNRASESVSEARQGKTRAEEAVTQLMHWERVMGEARRCEVLIKVSAVLDPRKGLRGQRIRQGAERLGRYLDRFAMRIGLGEWSFNPERLEMRCHGRAMECTSSSEWWLTATVLRLSLCAMVKAPVAVVDGADVLDPDVRTRMWETVNRFAARSKCAVLWNESHSEVIREEPTAA